MRRLRTVTMRRGDTALERSRVDPLLELLDRSPLRQRGHARKMLDALVRVDCDHTWGCRQSLEGRQGTGRRSTRHVGLEQDDVGAAACDRLRDRPAALLYDVVAAPLEQERRYADEPAIARSEQHAERV